MVPVTYAYGGLLNVSILKCCFAIFMKIYLQFLLENVRPYISKILRFLVTFERNNR